MRGVKEPKRKRQYEHIKEASLKQGRSERVAKRIAAATVNKTRREKGEPIWTPLIPASFKADKMPFFGEDTILGRPGQQDEIAPCYVFLACDDSSYMTGQVLHPNGGRIVNF